MRHHAIAPVLAAIALCAAATAQGGRTPLLAAAGMELDILGTNQQWVIAQCTGHDAGAAVVGVREGSLAHRAGLRKGQVLLWISDEKITGPRSAEAALRGKTGTLELRVLEIDWDAERCTERKLTMDVGPGLDRASEGPTSSGLAVMSGSSPRLGIATEALPDALEAALKHTLRRPGGVRVGSVALRSPAAEAGIRQGDILLAVSGRNITSAEQIAAALPSEGGDVELLIARPDRTGSLEVISLHVSVPAVRQGDAADDARHYRDPGGWFEFSYPRGWTLTTDDSGDLELACGEARVQLGALETDATSAWDEVDQAFNSIREEALNYQERRKGPINVGGLRGLEWEFRTTKQTTGVDLVCSFVVLMSPPTPEGTARAFMFAFSAPERDFELLECTRAMVLGTFRPVCAPAGR